MKRYSLITLAGILFLLASCKSSKQDCISATTKKNIEAMHGIFNCFNTADFSKLSEFVAVDCIDHSSGGKEDVKGLAQMKENYEQWSKMVENTRTATKVEMANDEYVISWVSFQITMKTDLATKKVGETFNKSNIEMLRFKDGKAVEHWTFIDSRDIDKVLASETQ